MTVHCRDFLETSEGLLFAVVAEEIEEQRHLCFLRYLREPGGLKKTGTAEANQLLASSYPDFLYYSRPRDTWIHAVPRDRIKQHHSCRDGIRRIQSAGAQCVMQHRLLRVLELLQTHGLPGHSIGITGSLLIGAQTAASDIDLVIYGRTRFNQARSILRELIRGQQLQPLSESLWRESYARRQCSLDFEEYLWHEKRKFNKASIEGSKIDLSLVDAPPPGMSNPFRKTAIREIRATVTDDRYSFDHPAIYSVDHPEIPTVFSFTPTYAGQARCGERLIARGHVEVSAAGEKRLVTGASREAEGEYIRVETAADS